MLLLKKPNRTTRGRTREGINTLQHLMDSQNENNEIDNVDTFHNLETKKRELEEIVEYRTRGSILKPDAGGLMKVNRTPNI